MRDTCNLFVQKLCLSLLILGLSSSLAFAANLAVYPFSSPDILTGVAISERVASAFSPLGDVLGPVETPSLIPPLVVEGGFLSPVVFLPSNVQANGLASPEGAALVQGSLGADAAVTGALRFEDARLVLELFVADFRGMRSYTLYAPEDNPGDLAEQTVALLLRHLSVRNERLIRRVLRTDTDIDLSSDYSEYVRAVALIGGGFANEAEAVLASLADETDGELPRAWRGLALALEGIRQGEASRNVLRDAALALSLNEVNEQQVIGYFETLAADEVLPAANVWLGTLRSDVNDRAGSNSAFEAAATYPYGRAARATYLAVNRLEGATDIINQLTFEDDIAALIAASYAAFELDENGLEKTIHTRLNRIAPGLSYPFERLSFIAFDEDDADAATQALVVATRIEPDEDLYWTNLGWSYYLQGRLEESRIASQRAVTLEPAQEIAWFNLGLAYAVDGDLEQALPAYESALELDPEVNDEAVVDLENALVDYPGVAGVNFALATLYEAEGRKDESIDQFEAYLSQLEDDTSPFGRTALQRLEVLRAPPPPLEIGDEVNVTLGREGDVLSSFEPGDRIYPAFELFTPGIELPRMVMVSYDLIDPSGDSILNEPLIQESDIPQNVVAIDFDGVGITLPMALEAGAYSLNITISTPDGREADQVVKFAVGDTPSLLRQFVSRNITMRAIDSGAPLYDGGNLATGDDRLVAVLLEELRQTASLAAEALPAVEEGRFAGLDGEALFLETSDDDISDFLNYLLASPGTTNADFSFVEAYAQWALEGAPIDP